MPKPVTTRAPKSKLKLIFGLISITVLLSIIGVLIMAAGTAFENWTRVCCGNNLRQIALAIRTYSDENDGQYPSELGTLILTHGLSAESFVCGNTDDGILRAPPAQQAATLLSGGHCSYVYVGAGMNISAGANDVVAFELPDNHGREGGNVVYGDGHVSWVLFDALVQLVGELEAGRNPPVIRTLTAGQAKTMYKQKWVPKLASIKDGTWAALLPRPATRPSAEAK